MTALALQLNQISAGAISPQITTPLEHLQAVASRHHLDHLIWFRGPADAAQANGKSVKAWDKAKPHNVAKLLNSCQGLEDIFFTPNEFVGWRKVKLLTGLNAFYVDIDLHNDESQTPVEAAQTALDKISAARIPSPTMVVYTGRGAHIYWCFNRTPARALPRWQAVQRELVRVAGGDKSVVDCTRVLRLVGTSNPKAPSYRRTVTSQVLSTERYDFDWLCDQIIIPRAEIRDLRAARAQKDSKAFRPTGRNYNSIGKVWAARYQDMHKLLRANWPNGVVPDDSGQRNHMLYFRSVALSWIVQPEALRSEIEAVARRMTPSLSDPEISSAIISVMDRATKAGEGVKIDKQDPRYRYKADTLWESFEHLAYGHPEVIDQLQAIMPPGERKRRRKEQDKTRDRVTEGRYQQSRGDYLSGKQYRYQHAVTLWLSGHRVEQIAVAMGVTGRTVSSYLKAYKADPTAYQTAQDRFSQVAATTPLPTDQTATTAPDMGAEVLPFPSRDFGDPDQPQELRAKTTRKSAPDLNVAPARAQRPPEGVFRANLDVRLAPDLRGLSGGVPLINRTQKKEEVPDDDLR